MKFTQRPLTPIVQILYPNPTNKTRYLESAKVHSSFKIEIKVLF